MTGKAYSVLANDAEPFGAAEIKGSNILNEDLMNYSPLSCHSYLIIFIVILLGSFSGLALGEKLSAAEGYAGEGPDLVISSVYGNLELGRPSSIFVVLKNDAAAATEEDEMALRKDAARSISTELISSEDRIRVLSRPQFAGLLAGGENTTLQFTALAEGVPLGLYPFHLRCSFSRLSGVTATGEEGAPDLFFDYRAASLDLPLQVEAVMGPRIEMESPDGWWDYMVPGKESGLELILTNRGDEPAVDLELQVRPSPPVLMIENGWVRANLSAGESEEARLSLFADENASFGYYALPCSITYRDAPEEERRREEMAAVIYVGQRLNAAWIYLAAGALAIILLLSGWWALAKLRRSRRRLRIVKS